MNKATPKYPVYIISKGRWETRLTAKSLDAIDVPYSIVIEPQERDKYESVIDPGKVLVLPFSNLGLGSIPARNWVWEHATSSGARKHWILDDNIAGFVRQNNNERIPLLSGAGLLVSEVFADRYENIALAGLNYRFLGGGTRSATIPPFLMNTRIYSCILIRNDLRLGIDGVGQWRGRYNEDTDLSIRALKDGWCTVLFNAFKINKIATMKMTGGNTDELYINDGRLKMAESLREQHPDIVKITRKWGRWQHSVDYRPFKRNKLIRRSDSVFPEGVNNYGMTLKVFDEAPELEQSAPIVETQNAPETKRFSIEYFARLQDELRERGRLSAIAWHHQRGLECSL